MMAVALVAMGLGHRVSQKIPLERLRGVIWGLLMLNGLALAWQSLPGVLAQLQARGVQRASVTLHVGAGTFQPVRETDLSRHHMHAEIYDIPRATVDAVAAAHRVTPAAVALAWLIARPSITAPIASATSVEQVKDFVLAANLKLTKDDIAVLDKSSA